MNPQSQEEHRQIRESWGYLPLEDWCCVRAAGADVFEFLQTQTTNDVHRLKVGEGQNSAITDRKARLIAPFSLHRDGEESVVFFLESCLKGALTAHLESYLFREKVTIEPLEHKLIAVQGPKSALALRAALGGEPALPDKPNSIASLTFEDEAIPVIHKSLTGEEGFILLVMPERAESLLNALRNADGAPAAPLSRETLEVLRIEAGIPLFGKDMDNSNVFPETGLEHSSVSYNKGCYIGQEVIARIKTYGAPNFALMGLLLPEGPLPPPDTPVKLKDKKIGTIKSAIFSPSLGKNIALAYMQKDHRSPDTTLSVTLRDTEAEVTTHLLPFYQPQTRTDHSKRLLQQALAIYKEEEDLERPIALLREAIAIDPKHAQAYEALGVFLSKQDKLDEAIALMKRLVEIDPKEIMAHSNLSIYYMKQGRIEEAEMEKGEATAIEFERLVEQNMAKKKKQQQDAEAQKERERKVEMFKKVLEIDPVDPVANFGLGSIYLETGRSEEALAPLETVIRENKDYSAAYLLLGKNLEKLDRLDDAIEIYRQGIAAASKKGDLMPLKDMQNRLNRLLHPQEP